MTDASAKAEAWYARAGDWQDELRALRAILRACPLSEDFKWNSPCYCFEGGNVVTVWRLKEAAALAFFKGALIGDADGLLVAPGENSRSMRKIEFTGTDRIARMAPALRRLIDAAIAVEKAGLTVEFRKDDLEPPEELAEALARRPDLSAAFEALTPGRRRGYILHISQARRPETRLARIEKHAPRILAGKGLHDR